MGERCCVRWHELAYDELWPFTRQQNKDDACCECLTGRHSGGGRSTAMGRAPVEKYHIEASMGLGGNLAMQAGRRRRGERAGERKMVAHQLERKTNKTITQSRTRHKRRSGQTDTDIHVHVRTKLTYVSTYVSTLPCSPTLHDTSVRQRVQT